MKYEGQNKGENGIQCVEFDARLADVLDGTMSGAELEAFKGHAAACNDCGPLFTQAQAGMLALRSLAEVEAPLNLVHNIIARTSAVDPAMARRMAQVKTNWLGRAREWASPVLNPVVRVISQPRLAMTTAMAFFSLSLVLNLAGVKMSDFRHVDLRPSAITTTASMQYHQTTAKVVKYYENIRFVYELESRMKELTKDATKNSNDQNNDQKGDKKDEQKQQPDNTSQKPGSNNKDYSLGEGEEILAVLRFELPGVVPMQAQNNGRIS
jgi:hypothetical protein